MTDALTSWALAVWEVLALSGPWLLLGFVLAGVIHVVLPTRLVYRHLGGDDLRSVFTASVAGVPIPLCSCSVLPTAMSLRKAGASRGATTSFLISTPETGVDSIGITWALMDPVMTVVRPLAALLTALGAGLLVNLQVRLGLAGSDDGAAEEGAAPGGPGLQGMKPATAATSCWDDGASSASAVAEAPGVFAASGDPCCDDGPAAGATDGRETPGFVTRVFAYAFGTLLDDLTPWFLIGLAASGAIAVLVPDDAFGAALAGGWLAMFAMLVIGAPMYVCATASTPIAAALVAKGLDPGAALVFLLAGPATNLATIAVVRGFLGVRVLVVYLVGIAVMALACGALLGPVYAWLDVTPFAQVTAADHDHLGAVATAGGLVTAGLLAVSSARLLRKRWGAA